MKKNCLLKTLVVVVVLVLLCCCVAACAAYRGNIDASLTIQRRMAETCQPRIKYGESQTTVDMRTWRCGMLRCEPRDVSTT